MRKLLTALALLGPALTASAADNKADNEKKTEKKAEAPGKREASLKVGDPAPALKATRWLQGTEVSAFAPRKLYVVEFWATWCGPCVVMMPHLSQLQSEY